MRLRPCDGGIGSASVGSHAASRESRMYDVAVLPPGDGTSPRRHASSRTQYLRSFACHSRTQAIVASTTCVTRSRRFAGGDDAAIPASEAVAEGTRVVPLEARLGTGAIVRRVLVGLRLLLFGFRCFCGFGRRIPSLTAGVIDPFDVTGGASLRGGTRWTLLRCRPLRSLLRLPRRTS